MVLKPLIYYYKAAVSHNLLSPLAVHFVKSLLQLLKSALTYLLRGHLPNKEVIVSGMFLKIYDLNYYLFRCGNYDYKIIMCGYKVQLLLFVFLILDVCLDYFFNWQFRYVL